MTECGRDLGDGHPRGQGHPQVATEGRRSGRPWRDFGPAMAGAMGRHAARERARDFRDGVGGEKMPEFDRTPVIRALRDVGLPGIDGHPIAEPVSLRILCRVEVTISVVSRENWPGRSVNDELSHRWSSVPLGLIQL
jgi:hypothetical protein